MTLSRTGAPQWSCALDLVGFLWEGNGSFRVLLTEEFAPQLPKPSPSSLASWTAHVLYIRHSHSHSTLFGSLHVLSTSWFAQLQSDGCTKACLTFAGGLLAGRHSTEGTALESLSSSLLKGPCLGLLSVLGCLLNNLIKHYFECSSEPKRSCASRRRKEPADKYASQQKVWQKTRNPFRKSIQNKLLEHLCDGDGKKWDRRQQNPSPVLNGSLMWLHDTGLRWQHAFVFSPYDFRQQLNP